jgi:hypothetical protein
LEEAGIEWKIILMRKYDIKLYVVRFVGYCEHGNEALVFIKRAEFLNQGEILVASQQELFSTKLDVTA